jgi:chromatin remodeling complex protein RSC6
MSVMISNDSVIIENNEETNEKQPGTDICEQFESIIDSLHLFRSQINGLQQQIRVLEKNIKKQMKTLKKESTKSKNKGNRKPSGFAKPSKVTNELCEFMNKKEGTEIARTEVTRALCSYIKQHKLENTENSKIIAPDDKLKTLLGIEEGQELTYFTIQKFMNKHFI